MVSGTWDDSVAETGEYNISEFHILTHFVRPEVSPPLDVNNPLLISKEMLGSQEVRILKLI